MNGNQHRIHFSNLDSSSSDIDEEDRTVRRMHGASPMQATAANNIIRVEM